MELTINIENKTVYQSLLQFLKSIKITTGKDELVITQSKFKSIKEFRALSGLWKNRDITVKQIREKAWPNRK